MLRIKRHNIRGTTTFVNPPLDDKEQNITVRKGQEFTITLDSNPTSGYKWVPTFNNYMINIISHNFQPTSPVVIGGSGKDIFTFKARNTGSTVLKMVYKRSWEQQFVDEKNFLIDIG
jgi:inhibitor of cysteine peptidase